MCLPSGDEVTGRASVSSRVSGCQVAYQQDQRVGELPRSELLTTRGKDAGMGVLCVIHPFPWQRCVQVPIGYTGEMKVSALSGLLPLAHTEASWDVWGKQRSDGKMDWWGRGCEGGNMNKISCLMNKPSQFLDRRMQILSGAWNQESWFNGTPISVTFGDNVEWLLWVKAASGIQWKGFLFTLAIWNFPWKRLESFLMADSVYLSRTPQGLQK